MTDTNHRNDIHTNIKKNLLGAFEAALFMPSGAHHFSNSKHGMIVSFVIPFLALPITAITFIAAHPDTLSSGAKAALGGIYALRMLLYLLGFTSFAYIFSKTLGQADMFHKIVTAHNWLTLPAAALLLPATYTYTAGYYNWTEIYPLILMIIFYSYAYLAYICAKILRTPIELGIFAAIACLAIHQTTLDAAKYIGMHIVASLA